MALIQNGDVVIAPVGNVRWTEICTIYEDLTRVML